MKEMGIFLLFFFHRRVHSFVLSPQWLDRTHNMPRPKFSDKVLESHIQHTHTHTYTNGVCSKQGTATNDTNSIDSGYSNHNGSTDYINNNTHVHSLTHTCYMPYYTDFSEPESNHGAVASRQSVVLRWWERIVEIDTFFRSFVSNSIFPFFDRGGKIKSKILYTVQFSVERRWKRDSFHFFFP